MILSKGLIMDDDQKIDVMEYSLKKGLRELSNWLPYNEQIFSDTLGSIKKRNWNIFNRGI